MQSQKLEYQAKDLIDVLGDCAISVRLLATVLRKADDAKRIAPWLIAEQESYLKQMDQLDRSNEFINETVWLIYLLNVSGHRRRTFQTARSFLTALDTKELLNLNLSLRSGIALTALLLRTSAETKLEEEFEKKLDRIVSQAIDNSIPNWRAEEELATILRQDHFNGHPALWDTWRLAFLIEFLGNCDAQRQN